MNSIKTLLVELDDIRLDRFIRKNFSEFIPQSLIERFSKSGSFKVNNIKIKPNTRLKKNDTVTIYNTYTLEKFRDKQKNIFNIEKFENIYNQLINSIIYEDDYLIAFDKPNDLAVQGGVNINVSMDNIFQHFYKYNDKLKKLHIVHRLDKATSGVIIFAKGYESSTYLSELFRKKLILKEYISLCDGIFSKKSGIIDSKIWQGQLSNEYMCMSDTGKIENNNINNAKDACTEFLVIKENYKQNISMVKLTPKTGRKHQLRVHMKHIGHEILGDNKYSKNLRKDKTLFLHAHTLEFTLMNKEYRITAKIPDRFEKYMKNS